MEGTSVANSCACRVSFAEGKSGVAFGETLTLPISDAIIKQSELGDRRIWNLVDPVILSSTRQKYADLMADLFIGSVYQ
jgi:hypothetical protein